MSYRKKVHYDLIVRSEFGSPHHYTLDFKPLISTTNVFHFVLLIATELEQQQWLATVDTEQYVAENEHADLADKSSLESESQSDSQRNFTVLIATLSVGCVGVVASILAVALKMRKGPLINRNRRPTYTYESRPRTHGATGELNY